MNIKTIFGRNIRYYRRKASISQEKFSEIIDISPKHLSCIENGSAFVSAENLEKIAKALKVSVSALFYSSEDISFDESLLTQIDNILEEETQTFLSSIKNKLRTLQ